MRTLRHDNDAVIICHATDDRVACGILAAVGRTIEAVAAGESALALLKGTSVKQEAEVVGALGDLARALSHGGQREKGLALLRQAEALCLSSRGTVQQQVAGMLPQLREFIGSNLNSQGSYVKAASVLSWCLARAEASDRRSMTVAGI